MSTDRHVCSKCGVSIGPGEYKLAVRPSALAGDHRTVEERTEWMCRRCASRFFHDYDEDEDEEQP